MTRRTPTAAARIPAALERIAARLEATGATEDEIQAMITERLVTFHNALVERGQIDRAAPATAESIPLN